jgi:hypothetical protein
MNGSINLLQGLEQSRSNIFVYTMPEVQFLTFTMAMPFGFNPADASCVGLVVFRAVAGKLLFQRLSDIHGVFFFVLSTR